jgi:multiple sugar transport system ATP-binding protein
MVFQRPALYPHLTVEENLALGLRFSTGRKDKAHWKPIVANVSRVLHLEDLLDRLPMELSGGQQQRVALGRAIARAPGVLLLDEPLSNLDASLRTEMRRELHLLHQRLGVTMVYVTHDPAEALNLGERVALLQEGVLQQVGTPATIYERPANCLVAGSVGTPGMNLLDGELCGNQCEMRFCEGRAALRIPVEIARRWVAFSGRRLTLGIRPENVIMVTDSGGENARSVLMKGTLALAEWFGDHTLVTLHCETWRIAARMPGRVGFPVSSAKGELIEVRMDLTKVHLFDGVTGLALSHPGTG